MPQEPDESVRRSGQSVFPGPAAEDHGRALTTNTPAAAFYRRAQQAVDTFDAITALRRAVGADPAFDLAVVDLCALSYARSDRLSERQMNWERHHIEVVCTAAAGNLDRAVDLLREHLASVGCDPVARRIVTELRRRTGRRDVFDPTGHHPACHPVPGERPR